MRYVLLLLALLSLSCGGPVQRNDSLCGNWYLNYEQSTLEGAAQPPPMKIFAAYDLDRNGTLTTRLFGFGHQQLMQAQAIKHYDRCDASDLSLETQPAGWEWPYAIPQGVNASARVTCWQMVDGTRVLQILVMSGHQVVTESRRVLAKAARVLTEDITGFDKNGERYRMTLIWERR